VTVLFDVFVLNRSVGRMLDDALAPTGLNSFDFAMTSMLREHGPISPQRIAALTGMKTTTTSGVLRRLEERGLVARRPHPDDGRSVLLTLTPSGDRLTDEAQQSFEAVLARVERGLGSRLPRARAALQDLDDAVRAVLGLAERPYRVDAGAPGTAEPAGRLGPEQRLEVQRFEAWLLERDGGRR
jgi:DNA-binding MarR family transcriptional regulator